MWLTGRLMPDFKTIADFRKDASKAIRSVCRQFVVRCQQLGLFGENRVAIDGSQFMITWEIQSKKKPASLQAFSIWLHDLDSNQGPND